MTLRIITSLVVLLVCGSIFVVSRANQPQATPGRSYRLVALETARKGDGEVQLLEIRTRLVKPNGEWKEESVSLRKGQEGSRRTTYNGPDGQYIQRSRSPEELHLTDGFAQLPTGFTLASTLREHKQFVRQETLLGFTTYVLRAGITSEQWIEQHFAPELGVMPIKVVMHFTGGEQVIEAVQIEFIPVSDEDLARPSLPVKLDFLDIKIAQAEQNGHKDLADSLRKLKGSR